MKKKTILVAAIAVMLVAALVVGGTLAYFTDKDNATNTFTVGNVKIDLLESSLHRENAGYVGTPGEELNPKNAELWSEVLKQGSNNTSPYKAGDTFYTDDQIEANAATYTCDGVELAPGQSYHKMPYVKNTGANDAYIRIRVMIPADLDTAILNSSMYTTTALNNKEFTKAYDNTGAVVRDGVKYNVYTFTRIAPLKAGEMTYWNVWGTIHMDTDVTNEEIASLFGEGKPYADGTFPVLVEADAIQADGFANATDAFAAFGK
jgi:predicted ribosomally synthesized peptide with SipW-like signal peptide